ncbi:MAG TPA: hypothetical protein VFD62_11455 [Pyrinomonadaceae bacterium]|nr:hypothetical protein [Pyrinomonadaceae bacterium]
MRIAINAELNRTESARNTFTGGDGRDEQVCATRYLASDAKYGVETKTTPASRDRPKSPARIRFLLHRQQLSRTHRNGRHD